MDWRKTDAVLPAIVALLGAAALVPWIRLARPQQVELRVPGLDRSETASGSAAGEQLPPVAGTPVVGDGQPAADSRDTWPWFRGPRQNGMAESAVRLRRRWPDAGPPRRWQVTLGEGYAGPAIANGCVYVLDYDDSAQADTLRCLSLTDGREIWHNHYPVELTRNHGISRTVPAIWNDHVITIGPRCHVACWDARTGECRWLLDLHLRYGTVVPRWYTGQCPLIDQGRLIVAPAGSALMVALDPDTGKEIWNSPNPDRWEMTHSSIVRMNYQGRETYVYCASGGVVGVSADDGQRLWTSTDWTTHFATAPSPVVLPRNRLFLSSGYDSKVGSLILELAGKLTTPQVRVVAALTPKQFNSEQQTPILQGDHLFAVRKQGGGKLVCLDLDGNEVWNSGRDRFGHGPYLLADDLLFVLSNEGRLAMVKASPSGYERLGQFVAIEDGHDAWGPMALTDGLLVLRDMTRMACYDLRDDIAQARLPLQVSDTDRR